MEINEIVAHISFGHVRRPMPRGGRRRGNAPGVSRSRLSREVAAEIPGDSLFSQRALPVRAVNERSEIRERRAIAFRGEGGREM